MPPRRSGPRARTLQYSGGLLLSPCRLAVAKAERYAHVKLRGGLKRSTTSRRLRAQTLPPRCDRLQEIAPQWRIGPHSLSLRCTYSKFLTRLGGWGPRRGSFLLILAPRCLGYLRVNAARGAREENPLRGDWGLAPRPYFTLSSKDIAH